MRDDLDDLKDINENIEEGNTKNNDEVPSDGFLKIEPIKSLDSSNIKIETEIPKKQEIKTDKQAKAKKEEPRKTEDKPQNDKKGKDNSNILKIVLAILLVIIWIIIGYFVYSKFFAKNNNEIVVNDVVTETPVEETNSLAALEIPNVEPVPTAVPENIEETVKEINESINNQAIEPIIEEVMAEEKENNNNNQINFENDDYDLAVLDKVYDEVINKGNEGYLYNFSSDELAIIRNTLYARRGYKFKKKEYQRYFGEKSWYNPTTNSQNILTKQEEKLANIIKRYE